MKSKSISNTENLVFVSGPVGCGKSRSAKELCRHFSCTHFIDGLDSLYQYKNFETKCLVLTSVPIEDLNSLFPGSLVISFDLAMKEARNEIKLTKAQIQRLMEEAWITGSSREIDKLKNIGEIIKEDCSTIFDNFINSIVE